MEEWFFEINRLLQENGYPILFEYNKAKHDRKEANLKVKEIYENNKHLLKKEQPKKTTRRKNMNLTFPQPSHTIHASFQPFLILFSWNKLSSSLSQTQSPKKSVAKSSIVLKVQD
jgi:hypothetical protein